jgi:predicted nucleotidyltransferase
MAVTQQHIDKAIELAKEYGATKVLLFGSALNNPDEAHDLDIGISGIDSTKFFLFAGKLEDLIRISVDLIPLDINNPFVEYIKKHGKYIYES